MNKWAVVNEKGIVFEGEEKEMKKIWLEIKKGEEPLEGVSGNLKLVKIIESYRKFSNSD